MLLLPDSRFAISVNELAAYNPQGKLDRIPDKLDGKDFTCESLCL